MRQKLICVVLISFCSGWLCAQWQRTGGPAEFSHVYNITEVKGVPFAMTQFGMFYKESPTYWNRLDYNTTQKRDPVKWGDTLISFSLQSLFYTYVENGVPKQYVDSSALFKNEIGPVAAKDSLLLVRTRQNLILSKDRGQNFSSFSQGFRPNFGDYYSLIIFDTLALGVKNQGLYINSFNGTGWHLSNQGYPSGKGINDIQVLQGFLFIKSDSTLYQSRDTGKTWMKVFGNNQTQIRGRLRGNRQRLYVNTFAQGVLESLDSGLTWSPLESLPLSVVPYEIFTVNNTLYAIDINLNFYLWDGLWVTQNLKGVYATNCHRLLDAGDDLLAYSLYNVYKYQYNSWEDIGPPYEQGWRFSSVAAQGDTLAVFAFKTGFSTQKIWFSFNGGSTWSFKANPKLAGASYGTDKFLKYLGDTLYAYGDNTHLFYSKDHGDTWGYTQILRDNYYSTPIAFSEKIFLIGDKHAAVDIFNQNTGQITTQNVTSLAPNSGNWRFLAQSEDTLLIVNNAEEFKYCTSDISGWQDYYPQGLSGFHTGMETPSPANFSIQYRGDWFNYRPVYFADESLKYWQPLKTPLPFNFHTSNLVVRQDTLFAIGLGDEVLKIPFSQAVISLPEIGPSKTVNWAFPNPVQDELQFAWEKETSLHIQLFNVTGMEILKTRISSTDELNLTHLNPGVYWLQISANGESYTQKLLKK